MAALMVEHLKVLISRAPKGPYGRAPLKGDGGLISRACLRILNSRACLRILTSASLGVDPVGSERERAKP